MTLFVCFCLLDLSALTPCLCRVAFCGKRPVGLNGLVSLFSWPGCFWGALYVTYVGCLVVVGFWLLSGHSLLGPSFRLDDWESHCPPFLYGVVQVQSVLIILCTPWLQIHSSWNSVDCSGHLLEDQPKIHARGQSSGLNSHPLGGHLLSLRVIEAEKFHDLPSVCWDSGKLVV